MRRSVLLHLLDSPIVGVAICCLLLLRSISCGCDHVPCASSIRSPPGSSHLCTRYCNPAMRSLHCSLLSSIDMLVLVLFSTGCRLCQLLPSFLLSSSHIFYLWKYYFAPFSCRTWFPVGLEWKRIPFGGGCGSRSRLSVAAEA